MKGGCWRLWESEGSVTPYGKELLCSTLWVPVPVSQHSETALPTPTPQKTKQSLILGLRAPPAIPELAIKTPGGDSTGNASQ